MSFLGISKSFSNKEWVGPSEQLLQKSLVYSKSLSIPQLSAYQLIKNKLTERDYLEYISPKIKNLMPSPKIFLDMEKSTLRLLKAIEKKETIAIFADYDVDGTVSAALISLWLRNFGIKPWEPGKLSRTLVRNPGLILACFSTLLRRQIDLINAFKSFFRLNSFKPCSKIAGFLGKRGLGFLGGARARAHAREKLRATRPGI